MKRPYAHLDVFADEAFSGIPLAEAGEAHAALESRGTAGKVLLRIRHDA